MKQSWKLPQENETYNNEENITEKILNIRGIKDVDRFLKPSFEDVNSPWDLSNMKEAIEMISDAIKKKKKIGVYGDIDTDGVTSLSQMMKVLKDHNIDAVPLYHQRKDGHGVIVNNVPKDLDLLIIVDSSSNSITECKEITDMGIKIVVLDHHETGINSYATVVNPQLNNYSNKFLSGAGVVYQTCRALDEVMETDYANKYIDICAVGLIGDMMDVTNPETRALIHKGLMKIHNNCDISLQAILKSLKKHFRPNATTSAFYLVPFINSIIRLGKIEDIINILICEDEKEIKKMIKACGGMNDKRKILQADVVEEIDKTIDTSHKIIIINTEGMNATSGLNGLIANSIAQKYQKPTLVVGFDKETNTFGGSGRGYGNKINFNEVLKNTNLFNFVEGHPNSFGVEFDANNLIEIYEKVDKELENVKQDFTINADMIIDVDDISWDILYDIQRLSFICGEGFKEPLFIIEGLPVGDVGTMKDVHMKFKTEDLECVKFNVSQEEIAEVSNAMFTDVIGSLGINSWYHGGLKETIRTKQVMIKDLEIY